MKKILIVVGLVIAALVGTKLIDRGRAIMTEVKAKNDREIELQSLQQDNTLLDELLDRWDNQNKLAASTPRISLAAQVAPMQAMEREVAALSLKSKCYSAAFKDTLSQGMKARIDGYIAFMQQHEITASKYLELSNVAFEAVSMVRQNCAKKNEKT